jgi:SAM-dependent methyltransferase
MLECGVGNSGWTDELTELHEAEAGSNHYIDVASRRSALRWVRNSAPSGGLILDIGCSSGHMLQLLRQELPESRLLGADYVSGPLTKLSRQLSSVPFLQCDLTACPLEDASVDAIIALNVLEHIPDDEKAIGEMFRVLKPRGKAIVEVPAGPGLYDIYDRQLLHHRRYQMTNLISRFERSGFRIVEKSHLGFFLYPAFWLVKKWNRRYLTSSDEEQRRRVVASIRTARTSPLMTALMECEAQLRTHLPFPFGIRCLLLVERPATLRM